MTDQDGCPLCGSTRWTVDMIDVSSEGRIRHVPGLRHCLDCHDGGAPVLLAEVDRLREVEGRLHDAQVTIGKLSHEIARLHGLDGEASARMILGLPDD